MISNGPRPLFSYDRPDAKGVLNDRCIQLSFWIGVMGEVGPHRIRGAITRCCHKPLDLVHSLEKFPTGLLILCAIDAVGKQQRITVRGPAPHSPCLPIRPSRGRQLRRQEPS